MTGGLARLATPLFVLARALRRGAGIGDAMGVLHVLDCSLPILAGYTARSAAVLEHQASAGFAPEAITGLRQRSDAATCDRIGGILIHRTPPLRLPMALRDSPVSREILEMIALGRRLHRVAVATRPSLLHSHSPILCGIPAQVVARRLGIPHVYELRAFWEDAASHQGRAGWLRRQATRSAETRLCLEADAVVTICDGLRRSLIARGVPADHIGVVPNGVDCSRFVSRPRDEELAKELGLAGATVVGYVGTLFRFEGVSSLVRAIAALAAEHPSVCGLVVGAGEAEAEVRALAATLGLGTRLVITGQVPPSTVARLYTICDVLCYPRERHALTEATTPLKPLEAMAMGKAVVGSDVGGLSELIRDGDTGLLFRAGNTTDMVAQLRKLVDEPRLRGRLGEAARAFVLRERQWTAVVDRYRDVYRRATERHLRLRPSAVMPYSSPPNHPR